LPFLVMRRFLARAANHPKSLRYNVFGPYTGTFSGAQKHVDAPGVRATETQRPRRAFSTRRQMSSLPRNKHIAPGEGMQEASRKLFRSATRMANREVENRARRQNSSLIHETVLSFRRIGPDEYRDAAFLSIQSPINPGNDGRVWKLKPHKYSPSLARRFHQSTPLVFTKYSPCPFALETWHRVGASVRNRLTRRHSGQRLDCRTHNREKTDSSDVQTSSLFENQRKRCVAVTPFHSVSPARKSLNQAT